jgi:hypothetical protein
LAKGGKGGFSNSPVLVASNGSLKGLIASDLKYSPNVVIPAEAGIRKHGYPIEALGYCKAYVKPMGSDY